MEPIREYMLSTNEWKRLKPRQQAELYFSRLMKGWAFIGTMTGQEYREKKEKFIQEFLETYPQGYQS